jgi:hypothetical protein
MGPGKVVTVLHVMGEWAGQRLARRKPSCPSSKPFRRSAATNAMVARQSRLLRQSRQSRLLRQSRAHRPVLNLRGEMAPVEFAPRRSRQQNRPHKGEKPNRRRRAAIALVIRLALRLELRAVMVAPAYSPEGSVLDVLAFGSAETSAPTFRRPPTIGIWARLFEPTSHHRRRPRPIRLGVY